MRLSRVAAVVFACVWVTTACSSTPTQPPTSPSGSVSATTSASASSTSVTPPDVTDNPVVSATAGLPQVVNGTGPEEIALTKPQDRPALLTVDFAGTGTFEVQALDSAKQVTATLFDVVGPHHDVVPLDHPAGATAFLAVKGAGKWSIALAELSTARQVGASFAGIGNDFVRYSAPMPGVATARAQTPSGQFRVVYFSEGPETVFDSAQPFVGTHPFGPGPAYIQITATGPWSITVAQQ